jgi:hypothetical protein
MLEGLSNINKELSGMSEIVTFSYKIIVFIVHQLTETEKNLNIAKEGIHNIQKIRKDY